VSVRWWYAPNGETVGYLSDDGKSVYKQSGEPIGYREGNWIYTIRGKKIGYLDKDDKWIFSGKGENLGYLA
jgi:hypothetical protein